MMRVDCFTWGKRGNIRDGVGPVIILKGGWVCFVLGLGIRKARWWAGLD